MTTEMKNYPIPDWIENLFRRETGIDDTWVAIKILRASLKRAESDVLPRAQEILTGVAKFVSLYIDLEPARLDFVLENAQLDNDQNIVIRVTEDEYNQLHLDRPVGILDYGIVITAAPTYVIYNGHKLEVEGRERYFVRTDPEFGSLFDNNPNIVLTHTDKLTIERFGLNAHLRNLNDIASIFQQFRVEMLKSIESGKGYIVELGR